MQSTINWFANLNAQASANALVAWDGTIYHFNDPTSIMFHDSENNWAYRGIEVAQGQLGGPVSEEQLQSTALLCRRWADMDGYPLTEERHPFHSETGPGIRAGKSDLFPRGVPSGQEWRGRMLDFARAL